MDAPIPALVSRSPIFFVLVDRADGSLWMLNDNDNPAVHPVSLKRLDPAEMYKPGSTYVIGREIVLRNFPAVRLIVRDGVLGYDYNENERIVGWSPMSPLTGRDGRRGTARWYIHLPDGWQPGDALSAVELT